MMVPFNSISSSKTVVFAPTHLIIMNGLISLLDSLIQVR